MEVGDRYLGGRFGAVPIHMSGIFAAMDMHTNEIVWRTRWRDRCHGGSVVTAGDLIFTGRHDGRLTALDSANGDVLWEFQTGAGVNAPVATFEHQGTQYVVAYSAGNAYIGSPRGDSVWLFSLGGTLGEVPEAGEAPVLTAIPDRDADLANGQTLFEGACAFCHGSQGEGGHAGGVPLTGATELPAVMLRVTEGFGAMPPFGSTLTPEEIHDISAYVIGGLPH
jgi:quinohemoprotein ethanol dehydrogenase